MASKADDKPDIFDALDKAAEAILEKALASDSLPEAVKAFDLIAKFAENRAKANPPPKKKASKIVGIQKRFHNLREANGAAGGDRGVASEASAEDEPAGSA